MQLLHRLRATSGAGRRLTKTHWILVKNLEPARVELCYYEWRASGLDIISAYGRILLWGSHFVLQTDHQTLRRILDLTESAGRPARWRRLMYPDFELIHKPRAFHKAPHAVSWLPIGEVDEADIDVEFQTYCIRDNDDRMHTALKILQTYCN